MLPVAYLVSLLDNDAHNRAALDEALDAIEAVAQSSTTPWSELGAADIGSLRDALCTLMQGGNEVAWRAGRVFACLVQLKGRDAHRACDQDSVQALLGLLRTASASSPAGQADEICAGVAAVADQFCSVEEAVDALTRVGLANHCRASVDAMAAIASKNASAVLTSCLSIATSDASTSAALEWCTHVVSASAGSALALAFCQHVCVKAGDAVASVRAQCIRLIVQLAPTGLDGFVRRLSSSPTASRRLFACDLAAELFVHAARGAHAAASPPPPPPPPPLLAMLVARTRDKLPSVRQAALRASIEIIPWLSRGGHSMPDDFVAALVAACADERPTVRRAAVKAVAVAVEHCAQLDDALVHVLAARVRDVTLSVRKNAVEGLEHALARFPASESAQEAWCAAVLPLIHDDEKSVAASALQSVVGRALLPVQDADGNADDAWALLARLDADSVALLRQAVELTRAELNLRRLVTAALKTAHETLPSEDAAEVTDADAARESAARQGAWALLEALLAHAGRTAAAAASGGGGGGGLVASCVRECRSADVVVEAWGVARALVAVDRGPSSAQQLQRRVLGVLAGVARKVDADVAAKLVAALVKDLAALERPPAVAQAMVLCVSALSGGAGGEASVAWAAQLLRECEAAMQRAVKDGRARQSALLANALFLAGELAMLGFDADAPESAACGAVPLPDLLLPLAQALASPDLAADASLSRSSSMPVPNATRAQAVLAMGKMCLRNAAAAKASVPALVRELHLGGVAAGGHDKVRACALAVLSDLCRRHTNLVEPHLDKISCALFDSHAGVRKQALVAVAGLVQEDFVKLSPALFFRLLACVGDDDAGIASTARFVLCARLRAKNPALFPQHAAAAVFALAGFPRRPGDDDPLAMAAGLRASDERRRALYEVVFSALDEPQRLEACGKMRRDVLAGFLEGNVPLRDDDDPGVRRLVGDTMHVLQSRFAAVGGCELSSTDDDAPPVARATVKVLEALERRNVQDNVVPLLVSLREVALRARCGWVAAAVRQYLVFLHRKFTEEVDHALAPFRDVAAELAFDEGKGAKKVAAAAAESKKRAAQRDAAADDHGENVALAAAINSSAAASSATPRVKSKAARAMQDA